MLGDCDYVIFLVDLKCPFTRCCYNDFFFTFKYFYRWYTVFIECYRKSASERFRVISPDSDCLYALLRNRKLCSTADVIEREFSVLRSCNYGVQVIIKCSSNGRLRGWERKHNCISLSYKIIRIWIKGQHSVCRYI